MYKILFRHLLHYNWLIALVLVFAVAVFSRVAPHISLLAARKLKANLWVSLSCAALLSYALMLGFRLTFPGMIDGVESNVVSVSSLFTRGYPLYTSVNDGHRYSLLYGPFCYLFYAAALAIFGHTITAINLMLLLLNAACFGTLWVLFRQTLRRPEALFALGTISAIFVANGETTMYMARGDIFLILAVALNLVATRVRNKTFAIILFSISAAVCLDTKLTGLFYLLVPLYLLSRSKGRVAASIAAVFSLLLAILPFTLPGISLPNYIVWFHLAARHPLNGLTLLRSTFGFLIGITPLLWIFARFYRSNRTAAIRLLSNNCLLGGVFLVSSFATVLASGKAGAGEHHLNPTCIVCVCLAALLWSRFEPLSPPEPLFPLIAIVYAGVFFLPSLDSLHFMQLNALEKRTLARDVNADIDGIIAAHPNQTIEMGYNQIPYGEVADHMTNFANRLVLAGSPYLVDAATLSDAELAGLNIPQATINDLAACEIDVWLIPRGGDPFAIYNVYVHEARAHLADIHLFDAAFRGAFFSSYSKTGSSRYYDLWQCRASVEAKRQ